MRGTTLAILAALLTGAAPEPAAPAGRAAAPARPGLVFGIGAPNGDEQAIKARSLLEPYLSKALGVGVKVRIVPEYADLAAALPRGEVDAAWLTPIAYVRARLKSKDVTALVKSRRNGNTSYRTAFIVRKDSPARTLADLEGKSVAWVAPSSASGYLFARALVASRGKDPNFYFGDEMFAGSHPKVCKAVRAGTVAVGATLTDPQPPGREPAADGCRDAPPVGDFRVVAASEPIPNDVVAGGPRLDAARAKALGEAFKKMADSPEGRALMAEAFRVEAWEAAGEKDFDAALRVVKEHDAASWADHLDK